MGWLHLFSRVGGTATGETLFRAEVDAKIAVQYETAQYASRVNGE